VRGGALFDAELVTNEPRQAIVVLSDLDKLPMPEAPTASCAACRLRPGNAGGVDVLASGTTMLEVLALARFATAADDDLVEAGRFVLARDEPNTVLEDNLCGVVPEELESA
jgi:hypothetical protein